jgi:hypothetical protein
MRRFRTHDRYRHLAATVEAGTIISRVWRAGKWIEIKRVAIVPTTDRPFSHRYEQAEHAEFYDKNHAMADNVSKGSEVGRGQKRAR